MEPKVSYSVVGIFVIVFGAALIAIVLWLARGGPRQDYQTYYAYFTRSVSGLNQNAAVKYKGVGVGRVTDIRLDPKNVERVRLTLNIAEGTPIKSDTVATLSMQGLTGLAFVELAGGSGESPPLQASPDERYPVIQTRPSFLMRLDEAASTLLANVSQIASALADLSNEENRASIKTIMTNVAALSSALKERENQLDKLFSSAEGTLKNTRDLTEKLPALIARVTDAVTAVQAMAQQIGQATRNANSLLAGSHKDIQHFTGDTLADVGSLIRELRELTQSLQQLSHQVEQNPRSLLFGRSPPPAGPGE